MISQLIRAWAIIGQQLLGMFPSITGYRPAAYTSDGIKSAMARCLAMGGGTVKLGSHVYTGSTGTSADDIDVTQYPGVSVIGIKPWFTSTGDVPIATEVYAGGTNLVGFGFYGNNVSQASPAANFGANAIQGIKIIDILFSNCTRRALDFGAHNNMGLNLCEIDVICMDCGTVDYAASFVNFANSKTGRGISVISLCSTSLLTGGGVYFGSDVSNAIFIPGNSAIRAFTQSYYRANRSVEVSTPSGCSLNQVDFYKPQVNRYGQAELSESVTMTNGSADITVTDSTQYIVGMPVQAVSTANGLTANYVYFVVSSAANVITLSANPGGTAVVSTGALAQTLKCGGFANFSAAALGSISAMTTPGGLDLECGANNSVSFVGHNLNSSDLLISQAMSNAEQNLVLRTAANTHVHSNVPTLKTDIGNGATQFNFTGWRGTVTNNLGWGNWNGHLTGIKGTQIASGAANGTGTATNTNGTNDCSGQITITPAGTPTAGVVATVTYSIARDFSFVNITPANAAANALSGAARIRVQQTQRGAGFDLVVDTALVAGTAYVINWQAP